MFCWVVFGLYIAASGSVRFHRAILRYISSVGLLGFHGAKSSIFGALAFRV